MKKTVTVQKSTKNASSFIFILFFNQNYDSKHSWTYVTNISTLNALNTWINVYVYKQTPCQEREREKEINNKRHISKRQRRRRWYCWWWLFAMAYANERINKCLFFSWACALPLNKKRAKTSLLFRQFPSICHLIYMKFSIVIWKLT